MIPNPIELAKKFDNNTLTDEEVTYIFCQQMPTEDFEIFKKAVKNYNNNFILYSQER